MRVKTMGIVSVAFLAARVAVACRAMLGHDRGPPSVCVPCPHRVCLAEMEA